MKITYVFETEEETYRGDALKDWSDDELLMAMYLNVRKALFDVKDPKKKIKDILDCINYGLVLISRKNYAEVE